MEQSASCAGVYGTPDCVSSTWRARVMFTDAGEGLLSITTRDNLSGTLSGKDGARQDIPTISVGMLEFVLNKEFGR